MSDESIWRTAKVVANDDSVGAPDYIVPKTGCIKIRIYPELADVADADLPWAMPESVGALGTAAKAGIHAPPMVNSFVRVRIEDAYFRNIFYSPGPLATDTYPYSDAVSSLSDIAGLGATLYPDPRLIALPDGTVIFWNSQNGDLGIRHKTGSAVFFASNGEGTVKAANRLSLIANNQAMGDLLKQLINIIEGLTTFGAPPQHAVSPSTITQLEALKASFNDLINP